MVMLFYGYSKIAKLFRIFKELFLRWITIAMIVILIGFLGSCMMNLNITS